MQSQLCNQDNILDKECQVRFAKFHDEDEDL